jgi:hypothetical protein
MTGSTPRRRFRWPIAAVLVVGLSGVVLAAAATVFGIGLYTSIRNTDDLLNDKAELAIESVVRQIRHHLDPARYQTEFLAAGVAARTLNIDDLATLADTLHAAQAGTPQVSALVFIDPRGFSLRVIRNGASILADWSEVDAVAATLAAASRTKQSFWGELVYSADVGSVLINLRTPLWRDGAFVGVLVSVVPVGELSRYLSQLSFGPVGRPFVLYGRDHVLAHPHLAGRLRPATPTRPLPALDEVDDTAISGMWVQARPIRLQDSSVGAHVTAIGDKAYFYLYATLEDLGPTPWLVGIYLEQNVAQRELRRLLRSAIAGLVILAVAVAMALWIARRIARPIRRLAALAGSVSRL